VPDFRPQGFLPQEQSLFSSLEGQYSVSSEGAQFPPSQDGARQQNPILPLPRGAEILDFDLETLGLPPISQQPMQYSQYPQLQQFQDVFMDDSIGTRAAQAPQNDTWWNFLDGLGIQRDDIV
jgi:hypothetical protein